MEKLLNDLTALPNIGKVLAENIMEIGIKSADEFLELGAEKSFIRIAAIHKHACLQQLYALDGAVKNIRWHDLSTERKNELKSFFKDVDRHCATIECK